MGRRHRARAARRAPLPRRAEQIESEARPFLEEQSYTRPFALRAVGISRRDESLIDEAAASFRAIGLEWRATETEALAADRTL